ncbi:MAG: HEPN domain-containing protein [Chloroflexi bacterium]|nr:HEPN domain-containing protein [Chloroflexota bacterium]MBU1662078.1 HEPN domain-containing protein [Chloroflexota bacterium]
MKPLTLEWIKKAEGDYNSALREFRARKYPNYDAACFHAQQCVEKYFKARLVDAGLSFPKIHDLAHLLELLEPIEPFWMVYIEQVRSLTDYAVEFRYPGESADKETARKAVKLCEQIRGTVRQRLGLKE